MRKIEQAMLQAVKAKRNVTLGNTSIVYQPAVNTTMRACIEYSKVFLHGNHIATYCHGLERFDYNPVTLAQWPTPTTKSRLRALGFAVRTVRGSVFVGDRKIV